MPCCDDLSRKIDEALNCDSKTSKSSLADILSIVKYGFLVSVYAVKDAAGCLIEYARRRA